MRVRKSAKQKRYKSVKLNRQHVKKLISLKLIKGKSSAVFNVFARNRVRSLNRLKSEVIFKGLVMVQSMLNFNVVHCIFEMKHQKPLKTLSEIVKISNNHVGAPKYNGFLDPIKSRYPHLATSVYYT